MESVYAIYDGNVIRFTEPVPVFGEYEVVVTFTKPMDEKEDLKQSILDCFGVWDAEDMKMMEQIIEERKNFSMNRKEYDFS